MAVLLSRVLLLCLPVLCHFALHCLADYPAPSRLAAKFLCPQPKREDIKTGAYRFFMCIVCELDPFCWKHKSTTTTSTTTAATTTTSSTTASTTTTTEGKTTTKTTTTKPKSETVPAPPEAPEGV